MSEPCRTAVVLGLLLSLLSGCDRSPPSQVIVVFDAEGGVAETARELRVVVCDQVGAARLDRTVVVEADTFPARVPVSPEGGDRSRLFVVVAMLSGPSGEVLQIQRAIAGFPSGGRVEIHRRFEVPCQGVLECSGLETCAGGSCSDAATPGLVLPAAVADALGSCGLVSADGDADADADLDAETDVDGDADADVEGDAEADGEVDADLDLDADIEPCVARNLVQNPGFEEGSAGWTLGAGTSIADGGAGGSAHSARITANGGFRAVRQTVDGVVEHRDYTFVVHARVVGIVGVGHAVPQASLLWLDASDVELAPPTYLHAEQGTTDWLELPTPDTSPGDAVKAEVTLYTWADVTAGDVYFDDVCLAEVDD